MLFGKGKLIYLYLLWALLIDNVTGAQGGSTGAGAADPVYVDIDTLKAKELPDHLSGVTLEVANTEPWRYDNEQLIRMLKAANVDWLRYYSGNTNNYYDWKLGTVSYSMYAQHSNRNLDISYAAMQMVEGMGGMSFPRFLTLAKRINAGIVITVNVMTDDVNSVYDLAKYVKDNRIRVAYWQLGNEPWAYLQTDLVPFYKDVTDYLQKSKPYHDAIRSVLPDAKTTVFTTVFKSPDQAKWVKELMHYPDRYWDAITFHDYSGGNGKTLEEGMLTANRSLKELYGRIGNVSVPPGSMDYPVLSTEWNSSMRGGGQNHRTTLYGALYTAEYLVRLSATHRLNIQKLGFYNGIFNIIGYRKKYRYEVMNAFEKGVVLNTSDTTLVDFKPYFQVPGLGYSLVSGVINNSRRVFHTGNDHPLFVPAGGNDRLQAMHTQAYAGKDGTQYLIVINKSAAACKHLKIRYGRDAVLNDREFGIRYISDHNYAKQNDGGAADLTIREEKRKGSIWVRPYSITVVSWNGPLAGKKGIVSAALRYGTDKKKQVPQAPVLRSVQISRSGFEIKWQSVPDVKGYKVFICTEAAGKKDFVEDVGNNTGYVYKQAVNGQRYIISVRAYNATGEGKPSNEITRVYEKDLPFAPYNLRVRDSANGVVLSWAPVWKKHNYENFEAGMAGWSARLGKWKVFRESAYLVPTNACKNTRSGGRSLLVYNGVRSEDVMVHLWYKVEQWTGSVGIVLRYMDPWNYYAALYDSKRRSVVLSKTVQGKTYRIAEYKGSPHRKDQYHIISFKISGSKLSGFWEGTVKRFDAIDTSLSGKGGIGVIAINQVAWFDKIDIYWPEEGESYDILRSSRSTGPYKAVAERVAAECFFDKEPYTGRSYYKVQAIDKDGRKSEEASFPTTYAR